MLTDYIRAAMTRASYEILEDGTYYGEIPGFRGVWANEKTLLACQQELQSALEDWMMFRIGEHLRLPVVKGHNLNLFLLPRSAKSKSPALKKATRKKSEQRKVA
jgi:predicted RNase H-like HicB family nuclease